MLSILIKLFVIAVGVIIVVNFLPTSIKEKALALLSSIVPDTVEEKIKETVNPILHTPVERREKNIIKLKDSLAELKKSISEKKSGQLPSTEEIIQQIENTEKIVEKIENANEEQSPINQKSRGNSDSGRKKAGGTALRYSGIKNSAAICKL